MPRVGRGRFPLVLIPSILFCLLFMPPRKAAAPPDPPEAAPSPHPARWAPEQQPALVHNPSGRPNSKWRVQALLCGGSCLSRACTCVSSLGWKQLTPWQKASEAPKRSVTPPLGPMTAHAAGRLQLTP